MGQRSGDRRRHPAGRNIDWRRICQRIRPRWATGVQCRFEREADYVGAYYAARAGYDLAGAEEFWRAFSLENPDSIRAATTHPVTPVRFVQIQKAVAEIADKQRRNAPLIPELEVTEAETEPTSPAENMR